MYKNRNNNSYVKNKLNDNNNNVIFVFSARDNVTLMILVTHQFRPFTDNLQISFRFFFFNINSRQIPEQSL